MPDLVDQHGYPIGSDAELGEALSSLPYGKAMEAIELLAGDISQRNIFNKEDEGWDNLSPAPGAVGRDSPTLDTVQRAGRLAHNYWLHNPLIRRGVETISQYVFGRGISIGSEDESMRTGLVDIWSSPDIQQVMGSETHNLFDHCSSSQVYGNFMFGVWPNQTEENRLKRLRILEFADIEDMMVDEWREPVMWLRRYFDPSEPGVPKKEWVPSLEYFGSSNLPPVPEGTSINTSFAIHHTKFGSISGPLGMPMFWPSIAWVKAYKGSLEDFAVVQRAYRTFAWRATGSKFDGLANVTDMVQGAYQAAQKSSEGVGRVAELPNDSSSLQPIRTANYQTPADGSRRLMLMGAAGMGLPETYFSDVSVGNYATSSTMERPVELMMKSMQVRWKASLERLLSFLSDGSIERAKSVNVQFPSILEHDAGPFMQAVKAADELSYPVLAPENLARIVLETLGFEDVEDLVARLKSTGTFDETRQEAQMKLQQQYAPEPAGTSARSQGSDYQRPGEPRGRGMPRPRSNGRS